MWSHGFLSDRSEATYLAPHLASHGYIVVAPQFPRTHRNAEGFPDTFDVVNQPGDLSFVLDTLLQWNRDASSPFYRRIDSSRIAAAGLSLGGLTTTLVSYHPDLAYQRISAVISVAGPLQMFSRSFFRAADLPFLMVAGDIDAMVDYEKNGRPVLDRVNNARLVTLAVFSFLQSQFAQSKPERDRADRYLLALFAEELPGVKVEHSAPAGI